MKLQEDSRLVLRHNVPLAQACTMHVGGEARLFAEPRTEADLGRLIGFAFKEGLPYFILGKGSNVIFSDEGYPGLVICLSKFAVDKIVFDEDQPLVSASAGIALYRLVLACRDHGLGGIEFLSTIPGSLGGALMMNAGFSRFEGKLLEIGALTESVTVLTAAGDREVRDRSQLQFSYRASNLEGTVILGASLRLTPCSKEQVDAEIRANFDYRSAKQDVGLPSSGSIFKNPEGASAGKLIDGLGLKGEACGGIKVSEQHANYFVNTGGGTASQVAELMQRIRKKVFDAHSILLEPEVRIIAIH